MNSITYDDYTFRDDSRIVREPVRPAPDVYLLCGCGSGRKFKFCHYGKPASEIKAAFDKYAFDQNELEKKTL